MSLSPLQTEACQAQNIAYGCQLPGACLLMILLLAMVVYSQADVRYVSGHGIHQRPPARECAGNVPT